MINHQLILMRLTLETFQVKTLRSTKFPEVENGTTITRKVDTTTIRITAVIANTKVKIRIGNLVTNANARRGIPRSPLYKNHHI